MQPTFALMKWLVRFVDLFLYTSLLTACCATSLCMATERLINNARPALITDLHILVFGSTLLVYNAPRLVILNKLKHHGRPNALWYLYFFFLGAACTAYGLALMSVQMISASCILGLFAFGYFLPVLPFRSRKRRLRDFGWVKISVLASVWTMATSVLPMIYWQKDPAQYPVEIILRLAFIFTLCIIFDIRDVQSDTRENMNTLPQKVGVENSYRIIDIMLVIFALLSVIQYFRHPDVVRLTGALLTAIITRLIATYLRRRPSDRAYLALADGVMVIYSMLVLLPF